MNPATLLSRLALPADQVLAPDYRGTTADAVAPGPPAADPYLALRELCAVSGRAVHGGLALGSDNLAKVFTRANMFTLLSAMGEERELPPHERSLGTIESVVERFGPQIVGILDGMTEAPKIGGEFAEIARAEVTKDQRDRLYGALETFQLVANPATPHSWPSVGSLERQVAELPLEAMRLWRSVTGVTTGDPPGNVGVYSPGDSLAARS